jgi:hypothetical protein
MGFWGKKRNGDHDPVDAADVEGVDEDDEAPGWDALDEAIGELFGRQEPLSYAPTDTLPGEGLSAVNLYRDGRDRWFLHTVGLSSLFDKPEDEDPDVSGWGIELTMRVPRADQSPPEWAVMILRRLADYVFETGRVFAAGHRMAVSPPEGEGIEGSQLKAFAFAPDPALDHVDTPNGRVDLLTVVGITLDELAWMQRTTTEAVLDRLAATAPVPMTDPSRPPLTPAGD